MKSLTKKILFFLLFFLFIFFIPKISSAVTTTCNGRTTDFDSETISPGISWQKVSGILETSISTKRYKVEALEEGHYFFSLCPDDGGGADYDSFLCLFDEKGDLIASNDNYCEENARIYQYLSAGIYYIQVSGQADSYGSFELAFRFCRCLTGICCDGCDYRPTTYVCKREIEYRCQGPDCGDDVQKREKRTHCPGDAATCTGSVSYGPWQIEKKCGSWQKCNPKKLTCECKGECIEEPKNPRYYDNQEYPTNPFDPEPSQDPNNIFLPVKLDWDDVKGWKGGWKENGEIKNCQEECVQSYLIRIEDTNVITEENYYQTTTTESEYNPREDRKAGICFFKTGFTHKWYVKACCEKEGKECGPESSWGFKTNFAPEPFEPPDPDWSGQKRVEDLSLDLVLKWCESNFKYPEFEKPLSYKLRCYIIADDKEICHPELEKNGECVDKLLFPEAPFLYPPTEFSNKKYDFFTKDTLYTWEVAACKDKYGNECTDYSQKWKFLIVGKLGKPILYHPKNDPFGETPVGLPVVLKWEGPPGAKSWILKIDKIGEIKTSSPNISFDYKELELNTLYSWQVQPCWDYHSEECEDIWSDTYYFKTTGEPPLPIKPEGEDILIPIHFDWEDVSGAKSYLLKVWGNGLDEEIVIDDKSEFIMDYPDYNLSQERKYFWKVKSCAWENGKACGDFSKEKEFETFKLAAPSNPEPEDGGKIYTHQTFYKISWQPVRGGRFYQYEVIFVKANPEDPKEECKGLVGKKIVPEKIIKENSANLPLKCWGEYEWKVKACLDEDCKESGDFSPNWNFTFLAKIAPPEERGGLVPCGRIADDPETPWDETEPCQIEHLFILLYLLFSFLLFKIAPLALVFLAIITAIIFYLSMGAEKAIYQIKSLWKAAGIGYAIIFFAWVIVDIFLLIFGYKVGIFGPWWKIEF